MIRLKKINTNNINVFVDFDFYIPVKIIFGSWDICLEPTLYWSVGNKDKSLIEVGIAQESGLIRSITLVLSPKIKMCKKENFVKGKTIEDYGVSIIDTKGWKDKIYLKEDLNFKICLEDDTLKIKFSEKINVIKLVYDRINLNFDAENFITSIEIKKINDSEKEYIKKYVD